MCLSVPQCNGTPFPWLPFTQNMHQGHRIRAATGRAKIVHYHGLKASRKTRSREVVLRPRSASRKNRMSSCCRRNVPVCFPFDENYDSPSRFLYPPWLVIRCPIYPLSHVEKVPKCASLVRLSDAEWDQCFVTMPVFTSFL